MQLTASNNFGILLRQLRKRAGMTQRALSAATGYSISLISSLERGTRLPDIERIEVDFTVALGLQDEPRLAARLIELALQARGERPPDALRQQQPVMSDADSTDGCAQLPIPPTPLVGRNAELTLLSDRIIAHHGRLMTLIGPPGVGKTRLALELAERLSPLYRHGVRFVSLAAVQGAHELAPSLVSMLVLPNAVHRDPQTRLIRFLRRRNTLLVLDNFEQLLPATGGDSNDATKLIATLLRECPELYLLVTSRERIHLRAEQRYTVRALDLEPAVQLFCQRAQLLEPARFSTEQDRAILRQICTQLDCLPLAIELAAARTDLLSPAVLLGDIRRRRLDVLVDGAFDLPPHQRTLRSAIQSSYLLLSVDEQRLFCALGVFAGGFDLEAAAALGGTPALLKYLVGKSMIYRATHRNALRFSLLETLREYALEQLERGQGATIRRRHACYYASLAQTAAGHLAGSDKIYWLDLLELEHENLREALRWGLAHDVSSALALAVALEDFWTTRGYEGEAAAWLSEALSLHKEATALRAQGLLAASSCHRRLGNHSMARQALEEAEAIVRRFDNTTTLLNFYHHAGWYHSDLHQYEQTLRSFQSGLALARSMQEQAHIARFLVAIAHNQRADPERRALVKEHLSECLELLQNLDEPETEAFVYQQWGALEVEAARFETAERYFLRSLTRYSEVGNRLGVAWGQALLGEAAWFRREMGAALHHYEEAHTIFNQLDNPDGIMITDHHLAQIARRQARFADAAALYMRSLKSAQRLESRQMIARCLAGLGGVALAQADYARAARLLSAARRAFDAQPPFLAPIDLAELDEQCCAVASRRHLPAVAAAWVHGQEEATEQLILTLLAMAAL